MRSDPLVEQRIVAESKWTVKPTRSIATNTGRLYSVVVVKRSASNKDRRNAKGVAYGHRALLRKSLRVKEVSDSKLDAQFGRSMPPNPILSRGQH